jgi:hypothetical protein
VVSADLVESAVLVVSAALVESAGPEESVGLVESAGPGESVDRGELAGRAAWGVPAASGVQGELAGVLDLALSAVRVHLGRQDHLLGHTTQPRRGSTRQTIRT